MREITKACEKLSNYLFIFTSLFKCPLCERFPEGIEMSCVKLMRKDACGKIVKAPVETYYLRKNGEEFQLTAKTF